MGLESWLRKKKAPEAPHEPSPTERSPASAETLINGEIQFKYFNRLQKQRVAGENLTQIADSVAQRIASLDMSPFSDSTTSDFSITIEGHPEIKTFRDLMQHASKSDTSQ